MGAREALGDGIGVGIWRLAGEERIKNGHDHQQLDDERERDFPGQRMVQKNRQDEFHDESYPQVSCQISERFRCCYFSLISKA